LQEDQRIEYVQRAEALLPLPLTLFGSLQSRLSNAGASLKSWLQVPIVRSPQEEAEAIKINMASIEKNIQKALTAEEYENILNHVNSYVQQLVELKMQQQSKDLPPQQVQLIVQLMKENLQQFAEKTQLTEKDLADLAIKLKLELQQSGDWQEGAKLSQANIEEITRLIKSEVHLHESHYTIQLEKIDFAALLERILLAPELADFVDDSAALAAADW